MDFSKKRKTTNEKKLLFTSRKKASARSKSVNSTLTCCNSVLLDLMDTFRHLQVTCIFQLSTNDRQTRSLGFWVIREHSVPFFFFRRGRRCVEMHDPAWTTHHCVFDCSLQPAGVVWFDSAALSLSFSLSLDCPVQNSQLLSIKRVSARHRLSMKRHQEPIYIVKREIKVSLRYRSDIA